MNMKNNKLIAEFMGFTYEKNIGWYDNDMLMSQNVYDNQDGNCFDELLFDKSWDWLMPVLKKINSEISPNTRGLWRMIINPTEYDIENVYAQVVEFINLN